ncbi:amino acid permease [Streptomyces sp. NPDC048277]|uniref:APC family permease n=1 Tax=Streptomyces sp. NPDC048277 TaxID=3155027 RepID=UPI0033F3E97E
MSLHDSSDDRELAAFGYKQELTRTLGSFSTFATGFAFISILTGMFLLFGFVYGSGGPASIWAWIVAVVGQLLFALAFAELAVRYPLAGSVYNWTKQLTRGTGVSWMAGVSMILALVMSTAAVALTMQTILPAISTAFWIYGDGSGAHDSSINGVILGTIMIALTTVVSLAGSKVRSFVNNVGVSVELIGSVVLIVGFLVHTKRGPAAVLETNGTGANYSAGYLGALLLSMLLGLIVMWGFDTAGSVSEETIDPKRTSPRAIIRAVVASGVFGALLILTAVMSVDDLKSERISKEGLAYVVKSVLGETLGDVMLVCAAIAVFVCGLANQTGAVNMMFAMARDNALPGSSGLARVAARAKTPVIPPIIVAVVAVAILVYNIGQPAIFLTVTSTTIVFALVSYILVVAPFTRAKMNGSWGRPDPRYFSLGKLGLPICLAALVWASVMVVNVVWPRRVLYNPAPPFHWYLQWGGLLFPVVLLTLSFGVYWFTQRKKIGILPEHASEVASSSETPADSNSV